MFDAGTLLAAQRIASPVLDGFFSVVTNLGHEYSYIALLLFFYWCVDREAGRGLVILFLVSMWLNGWLKEIFALPRPSAADGVRVLATEESHGFPSGHAQGAVTLWGFLAFYRRSWAWRAACVAIVALIGFSRLYLGAHFLGDVLGGFVVGGLMLAAYFALASRRVGATWPRWVKGALAFVVPVVLMPVYDDDVAYKTLGFLFGFLVSTHFAGEAFAYAPPAGALRKSAAYLVGLAGVGVLRVVERLLPEGPPEALGFAAISVWAAVLAPRLFSALGLASGRQEGSSWQVQQ